MKSHPPKWADRLLDWFCPPELVEIIRGDLYEIYHSRIKKRSRFQSNVQFVADVLSTSRMISKNRGLNSNKTGMYRNYFKVAWRNLLRFKTYSLIKIGGFALSIASCLLIALYILDEISYDKHTPDSERIYRLRNHWDKEGTMLVWPAMEAPMKKAIEEDNPGTESVGRLIPFAGWFLAGSNMVNIEGEERTIYEEGFVYADQEFIDIIDLPMKHGDRASALKEPNTIVISASKAEKYFGDTNPVGKTFYLNGNKERSFRIGGVMEDLPSNSQFAFDFIITLTSEEFWDGEQSSWCCSNYMTYIKLHPGRDPVAFAENMKVIQEKYQVPHFMSQNVEIAEDMRDHRFFSLQPLTDIHLYSTEMFDVFKNGDIRVVYMFGSVAFVILLLAIVNFINLSIAKSSTRSKEVGIRKVIGSSRAEVRTQFLMESFLFTFLSFFIGLLLAWVVLPLFNQIAAKSLHMPWDDVWFLMASLAVVFFVSTLAGSYPSLVLSRLIPIETLKGKFRLGAKSGMLQSVLVTFQFTTCVVLIIATIVVSRQMDFILNKDLGFDKDQVILLRGTNTMGDQLRVLRDQLKRLSEVKHVSSSSYLPISNMSRNGNSFWNDGRRSEDKAISGQFWRIDEAYLETMGMKLLEGRNLSRDLATDSASVIINQQMVMELGLENPIGAKITNGDTYTVIGVIEDFHFEALTENIRPLAMAYGTWANETTSIRVNTDDMQTFISRITNEWDQLMPNQPIRIQFMDERFAQMYENVKRTGQIFSVFAFLAITIAGLGLFALSAFLVEQRRKEISIRKVLGATPANLFKTLSSKLVMLVFISLIFALPGGWYFMKEWLADYSYRINLSSDIFLISAISMVLVAIFIVSFEVVSAIKRNPAETLHAE